MPIIPITLHRIHHVETDRASPQVGVVGATGAVGEEMIEAPARVPP